MTRREDSYASADEKRTSAGAAGIVLAGRTALGIELGSTRIKACLICEDSNEILAVGAHEWENQFIDRMWTYSMHDVWSGIQSAFADLLNDLEQRLGVRPTTFGAIGISAMMHGYLAFDEDDHQLVPFRTWRNTTTKAAATELSELLETNIPLRWPIAHLYQAMLDEEPHVPEVSFFTTLAGYVHWQLTGEKVIGIGDASGIFPVESSSRDYDSSLVERFDDHVGARSPGFHLRTLLPKALVAGEEAGRLTSEGALLLDPTGGIRPGIRLCPPEGDAGTGMVATNAVAPRTGNVSAGTSIFAMVVLESELNHVHEELDMVATPAGDPVAMVHCNNGASELAGWAGVFGQFAAAAGIQMSADTVFETLFTAALAGDADAGGLVSYNYLAGEHIAGLAEGRPLIVRTPDSRLTFANFARSQLYSVFGTLALGMRALQDEDVNIEMMFAHGGMFRTANVAQRMLAAALNAPVAVDDRASEGGAWGIAVLASYLSASKEVDLVKFLRERVFARVSYAVIEAEAEDIAGFATYLSRYYAGLSIERAAIAAI